MKIILMFRIQKTRTSKFSCSGDGFPKMNLFSYTFYSGLSGLTFIFVYFDASINKPSFKCARDLDALNR